LADAGVPRLLVLDEDAPCPDDLADDEDWVRTTAGERDAAARLRALAERRGRAITFDGRVVCTTRGTVILSSREATAFGVLLEHRGRLVATDVVAASLGTATGTRARTVHDTVHRLRRRLQPLQLDVFSARGRGYVLGSVRPDARTEHGPAG
jgi:DNA-binding response OmpR family regulator